MSRCRLRSRRPRLKVLSLSISLLASLMSVPVSQAAERWQRADVLTDSFLEVALKREYQPGSSASLTRWQVPITVWLDSQLGDARLQRQLSQVQFRHLSAITGQPLSFVSSAREANLRIAFIARDHMTHEAAAYVGKQQASTPGMRKALREGVCLTLFKTGADQAIASGLILIPVDYARQKARLVDCVVEESAQLMGLPNDSDRVFPSIFSDVTVDHWLSPLDYVLLKMLYAPELSPGMSAEQVRAALPAVIQRLAEQGELSHAVRRVRKGSLREWAGE
ncbi:DUF2927 domain-containing protein [Cobetia sp. 10Alg 146]|uniref:DUF2927 domain-containing protein n=1 Tax=Cobetia sp. 10Alg 146 TaxID=3040019 RepID=UPI00244B78E0|nr:DUF2927 domain-containing protein [Cobetia sp. 10Alg 146]MDH2292583.1 DUF2927 domain-containing protein [Cobetia sp. 10Alg 146]